MVMPVYMSGVVLLLVLLSACSDVPVNAPVGSRVAMPRKQPASTTIPAVAEKPGYHRVRRGDTLYSIAWQNGLNFHQLAEMNAIRAPYTIYVGQSLRLVPPAPSPVTGPFPLRDAIRFRQRRRFPPRPRNRNRRSPPSRRCPRSCPTGCGRPRGRCCAAICRKRTARRGSISGGRPGSRSCRRRPARWCIPAVDLLDTDALSS